jgi:putative Ca2+/H+ antiporter (TMEM165/GDT1 family)
VALAAKYHALAAVVAGTTLGMMLADVPVVLLGEAAANRLPLKWMRGAAAVAFVVLALLVLLGVRL